MTNLTPRQQQVLTFVTAYQTEHGYPPTLREIAAHLGVTGTLGVIKHLNALERAGTIRKSAGNSRGITLASTAARPAMLPVVGTVRAGLPQPAMEEIEEYFAIDHSQADRGGAFFLRVRGDSMINAAIMEGDLALVRPQQTAANRDIVVALVDGEATLKRFYRQRDQIRLQPENPNYAPLIIGPREAEVMIIGKVIGIYRPLP